MSADRGVSEAIGFVLVFAIITMTLGVVYASGFAGLQSAQQQEQLVNVERAFDVFSDNLRDIHQERAPSRAIESNYPEVPYRSVIRQDSLLKQVRRQWMGCVIIRIQ